LETNRRPEIKDTGVEFYDTIKDYEGLKGLYDRALRGVYDFYNWGIRFFNKCIIVKM